MLAPDVQLSGEAGPVRAAEVRAGQRLRGLTSLGLGFAPVTAPSYADAPAELIELETSGERTLRLTPEHPVFGRFLPAPRIWDVVLIREVGVGAALVAGRGKLRERGESRFLYDLVEEGSERIEEIHLLGSFATEAEAQFHKKLWATRHGLPEATGGYRDLPREAWRRLFVEVDTLSRAYELLDARGLDPDEPHWVRRELSRASVRKHLRVVATYREGGWDLKIRRPEMPGVRSGRTRHDGPPQRVADLSSYEGLGHVDLDRRLDLGSGARFGQYRAAGVQVGMAVPVADGDRIREERLTAVRRVQGEGVVYRLGFAGSLGILAEGLVVGNSAA